MEKVKVLIAICLVSVVLGVGAWLYISPKGSEGSNNLVERVDNLESRLSEQLVLSEGILYTPQTIVFRIKHIGTAEVTISEIRVNNVLNGSGDPEWTWPGWMGAKTLVPGQVGEIALYGPSYFAEGFTTDNSHPIMVITTNGNIFYFNLVEDLTCHTFMRSPDYIELGVRNTGNTALTISEGRINDVPVACNQVDTTLRSGDELDIRLTPSSPMTPGVKYQCAIVTAMGNVFTFDIDSS